MRGIEREERIEVTNLLRQGVPPSTIVKELGLPMSTVCEWAKEVKKELKKSNQIPTFEKTDYVNSLIKDTEIKITNSISFVITPDISDAQWFEVEKNINKELSALVNKTIQRLNEDLI